MTPDVTVILVTYNRAKFLPQSLDSILAQTYVGFELLICDDCSVDSTPEICAQYVQKDPRVRYIRNPENLKMPGNLNSGIEQANSPLIAVMHDGDIYAPSTIGKWRSALLSYPSAGFVFNIYRHLQPDGSGNLTNAYPSLMRGKYFLENVCFADGEMECPVWGTVMVRRDVLRQMNLFDPRYGFWSDMDFYFRTAEKFDVAFVGEPLIDLPSRQVMPHLFPSGAIAAHSTIFRIYWAARRRHFKHQPLALMSSLTRQVVQFVFSKVRRIAYRVPALLATRGSAKTAPMTLSSSATLSTSGPPTTLSHAASARE